MRLFDTHCHLDSERFDGEIDAVLDRAKDAGVEAILTVGCVRDAKTIRRAYDIAETHRDWITTSIGVHPHDAQVLNPEREDAEFIFGEIEKLAEEPLVRAIGETGLDYFYDHAPRVLQQDVFRRQIALARKVKKPLIVHTRDAAPDTLAILKEEKANDVGGIIHCFSEDWAFAKQALDLGFVASFSGIVTFKKAAAVQEAAIKQPADAMLIETDAPYLAPVPKRGKRNEPSFVAHTATRLAELRGEDPEALGEQTFANAQRLFGLS